MGRVTEGNLYKIFEREKEKLGLQNLEIDLYVLGDDEGIGEPRRDARHLVVIPNKTLKGPKDFKRGCRHELYHIAKRHKGFQNMFKYLFFEEPAAVLYEYLGIKTI